MGRQSKICRALRTSGKWLLKKLFGKPDLSPATLLLKDKETRLPFIQGANLPWIRYGCDFGQNAWSPKGGMAKPGDRQMLVDLFQKLSDRGIQTIRWFLLCDGRAGIQFNAAGTPVGPDHCLFSDIDIALSAAETCHLKIIFVLLDFLWFDKAGQINKVQVKGRLNTVTGAWKQRALRQRIIRPILRRYGRSPAILAWDIMNEPEWATRRCFGAISRTSVPFRVMRRFLRKTARQVHRHTRQLVTVGLANIAGLPLVRGIGLDFYQIHWYDRWETLAPLEQPVTELELDRPLLLGEYPLKNSRHTPESIVALTKKSGYCGALFWSVLGTDRFSGIDLDGKDPRK